MRMPSWGGSKQGRVNSNNKMNPLQPVVKTTDMEPEMLEFAKTTALRARENAITEKEVANEMKSRFEERYLPTWHCIVGRNFGAFVTHESKNFAYFYIGQMGILIFKSA